MWLLDDGAEQPFVCLGFALEAVKPRSIHRQRLLFQIFDTSQQPLLDQHQLLRLPAVVQLRLEVLERIF